MMMKLWERLTSQEIGLILEDAKGDQNLIVIGNYNSVVGKRKEEKAVRKACRVGRKR